MARADGTVLIGGESASFGAGSDDAFLLQLDANGRGVACNSWRGPGTDHGDDVELAPAERDDRTRRDDGELAALHVRDLQAADPEAARDRGNAGGYARRRDRNGRRPGGTVATPNGTSPGAGRGDAALVRIAP